MTRFELIANQSLKDDIVAVLNQHPGLLYSVLPTVHGRGSLGWNLGTTVWPETCFLALIYLPPSEIDRLIRNLAPIKLKYATEGMVGFRIEGARQIVFSESLPEEKGDSH